jgi:hypothetical protein
MLALPEADPARLSSILLSIQTIRAKFTMKVDQSFIDFALEIHA